MSADNFFVRVVTSAGLGARAGLEVELADGGPLWATAEVSRFISLDRPQGFAVGGRVSVAFTF